MDRVLITGISSYLGGRLAATLLGLGASVHGVLRPGSDRAALGGLEGALTLHEIRGDYSSLAEVVAEAHPDVVYHLATRYLRTHVPEQIPDLVASNVEFGTYLLEAMAQTGVSRFVDTASYFQYYCSDEYRPLNLYAATKQAFADITAYYRDTHGLKTLTLVLFDIYGPGDTRLKFMTAVREAQRDGNSLPLPDDDVEVDVVAVADVVDAFVMGGKALITDPKSFDGQRYAVASERTYKLSEIVETFERLGGRSIETNWGAFQTPERSIHRPWRGETLPGWQPAVSLEAGIRGLLEDGPNEG